MEDNDFSKIGTAVLETYFRPLSVMATRMPMQSATGGFTAAACAIRKREVNNIDFIVKEEVRETCLVWNLLEKMSRPKNTLFASHKPCWRIVYWILTTNDNLQHIFL